MIHLEYWLKYLTMENPAFQFRWQVIRKPRPATQEKSGRPAGRKGDESWCPGKDSNLGPID
jgi:hypothetical protein